MTAQVRSMAILAMSPTGVSPVVSLEFSEFAGAGPKGPLRGCPCHSTGKSLGPLTGMPVLREKAKVALSL